MSCIDPYRYSEDEYRTYILDNHFNHISSRPHLYKRWLYDSVFSITFASHEKTFDHCHLAVWTEKALQYLDDYIEEWSLNAYQPDATLLPPNKYVFNAMLSYKDGVMAS